MKKLFLILFFLITSINLFASAVITNIVGVVEIKENNTWVLAKVGQQVSENAMISTGFGSRATIELGGMVLYAGPVTRLEINQLSETNTKLSLQTGVVRATRPVATRTSSSGVDFRVSTPVATAAVRGTDFELSFNKLKTNEGIVSFSNSVMTVYTFKGTFVWSTDEDFTDVLDSLEEIWSVNPDTGSRDNSDKGKQYSTIVVEVL